MCRELSGQVLTQALHRAALKVTLRASARHADIASVRRAKDDGTTMGPTMGLPHAGSRLRPRWDTFGKAVVPKVVATVPSGA
jgi:hypothetical protein